MRKILWAIVIAVLLSLIIAPIFYLEIMERNQNFREPVNIYFSNTYHWLYDNETLMEVWNKTKDLRQVSRFSRHGNYSVLITFHAYQDGAVGYSEWFVVASTLQPSNEGLIHELVVRFKVNDIRNVKNTTFVKSYEGSSNLNITSLEDGKKTMGEFIAQDPNQYWLGPSYSEEAKAHYPFLFLFVGPYDFGITIISNLNTGKIMIAATGIWSGTGDLVYPEFIKDFGTGFH